MRKRGELAIVLHTHMPYVDSSHIWLAVREGACE
jgi:predicted glycosyl hydrolase (DUF1957 family)